MKQSRSERFSEPKRVAIYVRVSTSDGRQSTEMQETELKEFIKAREWKLAGVYSDNASGTTNKRPDLQRLMSDAFMRRIDVVCVWKMDRYARSLKDLVNMLGQLQDVGCEFVSLRDHLDFSTAQGRLLAQLLGSFAEFEASLARERVMAGLQNARRKGVKLGRPKQYSDVEICRLRNEGLSYSKIQERTGAPPTSIRRALCSAATKTRSNSGVS